jgi:hypothetical protein
LTQGTFLTSSAVANHTFPSHRGWVVVERMLCSGVPGVGLEPPLPPVTNGTTRDALTVTTSDAACAACHVRINPVGFAFEHFDSAGAYRDSENGSPIDASGEFVGTDLDGRRFDGALELSELVSESDDAKGCYVAHWMSFAYAAASEDAEACSRQALELSLEIGTLEDLLLALSQTDRFLYRPAPEQP